jgi:PRTRC genetic system ThiF family protein
MLGHLARIHTALVRAAIHRPGLDVTVIDDDVVTEANLGRQAFSPADLGQPKASVLVQRTNLFYGTRWESCIARFNSGFAHLNAGHVVVTCVDTIESRLSIWRALRKTRSYWLDLGNGATTGQVVLGETEGKFHSRNPERKNRLPHVFDLFPQLRRQKDKTAEPSCSLLQALERQDLFINSTLANAAGHLLWQLFRHGGLNHHGAYINLNTGRTAPIDVPAPGQPN